LPVNKKKNIQRAGAGLFFTWAVLDEFDFLTKLMNFQRSQAEMIAYETALQDYQ